VCVGGGTATRVGAGGNFTVWLIMGVRGVGEEGVAMQPLASRGGDPAELWLTLFKTHVFLL